MAKNQMEGRGRLTLSQGRHKGWDAYFIQRGPLELAIVPQVGGRVMGMAWRGHNLSFTQRELEGRIEEVFDFHDIRAKKRTLGFPYWGGDKTWLAPQKRWTEGVPFLDLDSGHYDLDIETVTAHSISLRMTSPICRETGIQIIRTLRVSSDSSDWTMNHRLINHWSINAEWGIWGVTMLLKPARVYLPRRADSLHPLGVKTFVEEGESAQARRDVVEELGTLVVITCQNNRRFKFGVDAQEGWILAILKIIRPGLVGYRKQFRVYKNRPYGHGCTLEVYNSDRHPYFEMEIHGPMVTLGPGESFELEERQSLFELARWPEDEEEVRRQLLFND